MPRLVNETALTTSIETTWTLDVPHQARYNIELKFHSAAGGG
ncbi:MAG: hypothetical protein PHI98_01280 [Eubacteriales bacterium]|nr:hypothetical protein [Eubacteriales bacterium]